MRLIAPYLLKDLNKKMVFLGGPRQCGKTTLAKSILDSDFKGGLYLNWDRLDDRKIILNGQWSDTNNLLIFDEVHKYKKWKSLIKGYYDTEKEIHKFFVTGSARLDIYQRGGDSLLGRYHYWRLHPFTLLDLPEKINRDDGYKRLLSIGGFPEVFLDNNEREARRWREERTRRILQEDIRDLEQLQNIDLLELLLDHLRYRVGSTMTISNIAQEIGVSSPTITNWLSILEKMYVIFLVRGYDKKLTRAVHKPIKAYFFDTGEVVGDESIRLENLTANHLLQRNHFWEDYHGYKMNLYYVKDKNQNEVDFLITEKQKPIELIETKLTETKPSKNLIRFAEILNVKQATQLVSQIKTPWLKNKLVITDPVQYFVSTEPKLIT